MFQNNMEFKDRTIHTCKHCGYMGKSNENGLAYGITGTYCEDCITIQKRREIDKIQLQEFGQNKCGCI